MGAITSTRLLLALAWSVGAAHAQERAPVPAAEGAATRAAILEGRADFVEARFGEHASIEGREGEKLGTLLDHVIERAGGRVRYAIVEPAGGGRGPGKLVRWESLEWPADADGPRLALKAEELASLPDFDPTLLQGLGADPLSAEPHGGVAEASAPRSELRNVLSSELVGAKVFAQKDGYGVAQALVLEPGAGRVAFVLVDTGSARERGTETRGSVLVPWQAMVISERTRLVVPMSAEALAGAPRIERTAVPTLRRGSSVLEEVYRFYKIPTPVHSAGKGTTEPG